MASIDPQSRAFTLLLGLLSALPTFGIDMIVPSLPATGAALGVSSATVGSAMSVYLFSLGGSLLVCGPVSDRVGRKPIVVFGSAVLLFASIGCMLAQTLPELLVFRALQGVGASGPGMAAATIVHDLFDEATARAKMSTIVFAINIVPMVAPSIGAVLLELGSWRLLYSMPILASLFLLAAMSHFVESAKGGLGVRVRPAEVLRDYLRVIANPICLGNALCNAASAGVVFAYITGSSLFLIDGLGLSPGRYGLIFGASSLSVMGGTRINDRLARSGVSPNGKIGLGLATSTVSAVFLLMTAFAGCSSVTLVVLAMICVALSYGLISPNAMSNALQPLPEIAGSVGSVMTFTQMVAAGLSSELVAGFFDGTSALSMAGVMTACCLTAVGLFVVTARRTVCPAAKRDLIQHRHPFNAN